MLPCIHDYPLPWAVPNLPFEVGQPEIIADLWPTLTYLAFARMGQVEKTTACPLSPGRRRDIRPMRRAAFAIANAHRLPALGRLCERRTADMRFGRRPVYGKLEE
jgi:hypothetical protein